MSGMERAFEGQVAELVELLPWMSSDDRERLRRVLASHFGLVRDGAVDLGRMAGDLLALAGRAEEVGDLRRAWAFTDWYAWACAALRGETYQGPEMPEALAVLS